MRPWSPKPTRDVNLPVTTEELDAFVAKVIVYGNLPEGDDTYESIATLILHMPQSVCKAPLSFFADSVNKSRANAIAYGKMQEFSKKRKEAQEAKQVESAQMKADSNEQPIQNSGV